MICLWIMHVYIYATKIIQKRVNTKYDIDKLEAETCTRESAVCQKNKNKNKNKIKKTLLSFNTNHRREFKRVPNIMDYSLHQFHALKFFLGVRL